MTRRRLIASVDSAQVEAAIARAEKLVDFELRIAVAGLFWGAPERVAERAFVRMGMTATGARNGVLLFVAPWRRRVVVRADQGITARVAPELWSDVVARLTGAFREGRYTEGLVGAVDALAAALAPHFPPRAGDRNELPDHIDFGVRR